MRVRNINGTSGLSCKCGSWLDHWKKHSKQTASYCSERSCMSSPEVGAHIQKDSSTDTSWYIVPLCHKHNQKATSLEIIDERVLVSANQSQTCGK